MPLNNVFMVMAEDSCLSNGELESHHHMLNGYMWYDNLASSSEQRPTNCHDTSTINMSAVLEMM